MALASPPRLSFLQKGKAKATEQHFDDLNPIITYRHLHSQNLGVRDPLRVIALCDSDAFYAACEMVRLGTDKDTPLVVLQWESLIAVNYPARKYGISRMDKLKDAKRRCPELVIVHVATYKEGEKEPGYWKNVDTNTHKVSLDYYRRESMKIAAMFKEALPGCEIEKASIDEAFFDFTKTARKILLERYPYLAQVPSDAPHGLDTPLPPPPPISWNEVGHVIPITPPPPDKPGAETDDQQGDEVDESDDKSTTWHDVVLSIAAELMGRAREDVHTKLGYSTSAGIARNKFLAKLTASYKKPNSQSVLRNAAIPGYLRPLEFQKIRFLGGKLGDALAREYDVSTVGDLLSITLEEMQQKFGENAIWVYEVLRGIDRGEVREKSTMNKSMLASKNLPKPITKASDGHHWIRVLAAELALRLTEARKANPDLWPKTIVLHARKGYEAGRSKQAPFPFTREATVDTITAAGDKLWKELVGNAPALKVTSIQLAFTGIEIAEAGQRSIEGFLKSGKRTRDEDQHGLLSPATGAPQGDAVVEEHSESDGPSSFTCTRCGNRLIVALATWVDEEQRDNALNVMRMEHEDFHFAQDLAKSPGNILPGSLPATEQGKKKKRRKEAQGIEKFFTRK